MSTNPRVAGRLARVLALLMLLAPAFLPSCGHAAHDCSSVCNRYRDCLSSSYDVGACEGRCRDMASKDADFDRRLANCQGCIEGRTCSEVLSCALDCAGILK